MKKLIIFVFLWCAFGSYAQNKKESLDYINQFFTTYTKFTNFEGELVEISPNVYRFIEEAIVIGKENITKKVVIDKKNISKVIIKKMPSGVIDSLEVHFKEDVVVDFLRKGKTTNETYTEVINRLTIGIAVYKPDNMYGDLESSFKVLFGDSVF